MTSAKLKFTLITCAAFVVTVVSAVTLRGSGGEMSRIQQLAWGAVMVASCLTVVRGLKYLGDHRIK